VRKNSSDSSEVPKEVLRLAAGQYFGERALLSSAKRAANVIAHGRVKLLKISRAQFEIHMGLKLQAVMDAENEWRSQLAAQREVLARKNATAVHLQAAFSLDDLVAK
jgi:CRP-like cAMP-binding protein